MNKLIKHIVTVSFLLLLLNSCSEKETKTLPYLGLHNTENKDTIYFQLPDYSFIKQDSSTFGTANLNGNPYIAYFFFTSCPSVCPRMTQGAKRVQQSLVKFKEEYNIIAFSIDPDRDTVSKLRKFAEKYDADLTNWHFLRGKEEIVSKIGKEGFYLGMSKDKNEPGGYMHSEKMVLIDGDRHIRGYYSGTDASEVKNLIEDLKILIKQESNNN